MNYRSTEHTLKRTLDVCAAAVLLVLLCPLMAVIWLVVRWTMGPGVIFCQQRAGIGGRPFFLHKFRTMTDARQQDGTPKSDADRLTPLGRFLRRCSLDELPQLWNVLGGQLSLVGPRPLLMQYVDRYTVEQARRLHVTPGITGWAQVHGRNAISWEEKFRLDLWYVDHWCVRLDLHILALTVVQVLRCKGISAAGHSTMSEFRGSAEGGTSLSAAKGVGFQPTTPCVSRGVPHNVKARKIAA